MKRYSRQRTLALNKHVDNVAAVSMHDVMTSLLVDLQLQQDAEAESFMQANVSKVRTNCVFGLHALYMMYMYNVFSYLCITIYRSELYDEFTSSVFDAQTELPKRQEQISYERRCNMLINVAAILFKSEQVSADSDDVIVQNLKDKYDALRDKILAEALVAQVSHGVVSYRLHIHVLHSICVKLQFSVLPNRNENYG